MKLISIGSLFSKKSKPKLKKNRSNNSPSFRSTATTSSSSDLTTSKSALRLHDTWYPYFSTTADLFGVLDRDGYGKITKRELEIVLRRLSPKTPTEEELASMFSEIDRDGDGCISLEELSAIGPSALDQPACGGELRDAFAVFDADGDGKISAEELLGVFLALGDGGCTLEDCHRMIGGVDSDGDGFVCFEDFATMMGRTEMFVKERQTVLPGRIIGATLSKPLKLSPIVKWTASMHSECQIYQRGATRAMKKQLFVGMTLHKSAQTTFDPQTDCADVFRIMNLYKGRLFQMSQVKAAKDDDQQT